MAYDLLMRRALLILALISGLLFAVTCVLWVRSYRHVDLLVRPQRSSDRLLIASEFGLLVFELEDPQRASIHSDWVYFDSPLPRRWNKPRGLGGFWFYHDTVRHYLLLPPTPLRGITVPHAAIAMLAIILPLVLLIRQRRLIIAKLRIARGHCAGCGYDLRASPDRCPECGRSAVREGVS